MRRNFYVGNDKIESSRQYKYLGFLVTPSGEIKSGLTDLKDRAQRALAKMKSKLGSSFRKEPLISFKLFRSLIEPILLYGSDFWGVLKMITKKRSYDIVRDGLQIKVNFAFSLVIHYITTNMIG